MSDRTPLDTLRRRSEEIARQAEATARIVACVNYCTGLDARQIEGTAVEYIGGLEQEIAALERVAEVAQDVVNYRLPLSQLEEIPSAVRYGLAARLGPLRSALAALDAEDGDS